VASFLSPHETAPIITHAIKRATQTSFAEFNFMTHL